MDASQVDLVRYIVGSAMIRFDILDELFSKFDIKSDTVVFHIDMNAMLYRCWQDRFAGMLDRADDPGVVINLTVSMLNVLAHYRKYTVFKLHKRSIIFVTYDTGLTKYQREVCPEYRKERMDNYRLDHPTFGHMNKLINKAYGFVQSISSYFEDIHCMDPDTGVDGLTIGAILRNDERYDKAFHVFMNRNMVSTQLINKNTCVIFNDRDKSKIITDKNCLKNGLLKDLSDKTRQRCAETLSPNMIPYIIACGGAHKIFGPAKPAISSIPTAVKIICDMMDNGQITNNVSIQSFLDELDRYMANHAKKPKKKKSQPDVTDIDKILDADEMEEIPNGLDKTTRELIYNRYRVLAIPVVCKSITRDQLIKIYRRCVNLFDQEYLESMNETLAQMGTEAQLIEITMLNTNRPSEIEYDGSW